MRMSSILDMRCERILPLPQRERRIFLGSMKWRKPSNPETGCAVPGCLARRGWSNPEATHPGARLPKRLTRRDVLLAPDMGNRQAGVLQQSERLVDHVGIAAQIGDIGGRVRLQLLQRDLRMAAAIVRAWMRARLAREAGEKVELWIFTRERLEFVAV